ncbi:hypothetical protein H0B56_18145 [Haloechinothrix sp. YIM 98757]|uniref:Uncharacterized protein n=1 Tax=Haloechinothrix aidingensis TaxID=2752311 RepID=A0A838AE32_9PSEU|nr:hypothetical protein [Haloechinothrix aidingensis]MBA0127471.1 hypothetical protein [Haloechinothrix aidingensis]
MSTTRHLPVSTPHLHRLIQRARHDLRCARSVNDTAGTARAERRMNALLDQLSKRTSTGPVPEESRVRA